MIPLSVAAQQRKSGDFLALSYTPCTWNSWGRVPGGCSAGLARSAALLSQGVLPAGSAEGTAGLLGLQPLLRRLRLRHRERQEEGGRGGGAGEPRRKRLQHSPQHLLLQEPPVRQLNPQGEAAGGYPGLSRGAPNPGRMRKLCPKPEPKNVSIPHKSDVFIGVVSKHLQPFQLFILEIQKRLNFKSLKEGQRQMKLFPSLFFCSNSLKILAARGQGPVRDEFSQLRYNSWKYGLITRAQHRAGRCHFSTARPLGEPIPRPWVPSPIFHPRHVLISVRLLPFPPRGLGNLLMLLSPPRSPPPPPPPVTSYPPADPMSGLCFSMSRAKGKLWGRLPTK